MNSKGDETNSLHSKRSKSTDVVQSSSTSMQDSIPFLPEELITEILSRLRVKTLLKFRCVSKSWLALISSPEFIKTHLSIYANNKDFIHHGLMLRPGHPNDSLKYCYFHSLLNESVPKAFELNYPMKQPQKSFSIVGSVNGLICITIDEQHNFLWNPSIRKFKQLPYSRSTLRSKYFSMYGFGYDVIHNDYKVVGITSSHTTKGLYHVKIYSLNSHCWRSTDDFQGGLPYGKSGVFVNGKVYWVTYIPGKPFVTYIYGVCDHIISVNLADGRYGKVEHPCYEEGKCDLMLGVLGSDLSMVCNHRKAHSDVWVMKEYGVKTTWTKILTINPPDNLTRYQLRPCFCMSNRSQILFLVGSAFMIYNLKDDSMRYLNITNCAAIWNANIYIPSLVLPFRLKKPRMQQKRGLKKLR